MTRYFAALAHERFPPDDLLRQAVEAERAGFEGVVCSDPLQPWWTEATDGAREWKATVPPEYYVDVLPKLRA